MASNSYEEILRIVVKTQGESEVGRFAKTLLDLGKTGELTESQLEGLAQEVKAFSDELDRVADADAGLQNLQRLEAGLVDIEDKLDLASRSALALKLQLGSVEKPTKAMQQAFEAASKEVRTLEGLQRQQRETIAKLDTQLKATVRDTRDLTGEQSRLRVELDRTLSANRAQAEAARAQAEAERTLRDRLQAKHAVLKAQAAASRESAAAADQLAAGTKRAAAETRGFGDQAGRTAGVLQSLRGAFAGILGYLSLRSAVDGVKNLLSLGDAAERTRIRLAALYGSQEAGNKAFDGLRQLAKDNAQAFDSVLEAATRLKTFGLDPLDGTLQGLIDQNAKLGGSQETLQGIILAVGQAWAKQKLQGEEILQLVERGVPVWDLLSKATGKNVVELQKLSEQGKLGRDVMRKLLEEIAKSSEGAAAKNLGTLTGLVQTAKTKIEEFFRTVNDSGVLDFFRGRLVALNDEIARLTKEGKLAEYARDIADGIITASKAVESGIRFVIKYSGALLELGKAYVSIKFASFIVGMASSAKAMLEAGLAAKAASNGIGGLKGVLAGIPASVKIAVAAVGLELAISQWTQFANKVEEARETERDALRQQVVNAEQRAVLEVRMQAIIALYNGYRDVVIKTAADVEKSTEAELQRYAENLEGARKYYAALAAERRKADDPAGAEAARKQLVAIAAAIDVAAQRMRVFAQEKERGLATVPTTALQQALLNLGVSAEVAGLKITTEGQKLITFFRAVATDATATAGQVRAAFSKALDSSSTIAEVQALQTSLRVAFEAGKISAAEFGLETGKAAQKVFEIKAAADTASGSFKVIGDEGEKQAKRAIVALEAVRDTLVSTTQQLAEKIAAAIESGADASAIKKLTDEAKEADLALVAVNKQIVAAKDNLQKTAPAAKDAFDQVQQGAQKAGDAAKDIGTKTEEGSERAGTAIGGVLGQLVAMYQKFAALSPAAAELFKNLYNGSVQTALSLGGVAEAIARAEKATDAAIASQRAAAQSMKADYDAVAEAGEAAGLAFQNATRIGSEGLRRFAEDARAGRGQVELLNQAELDELAASAEQAAQKVASIKAAAIAATQELEALNRSLQDEADRRAGNDAAILERQYQDQLRRIDELGRVAGNSGRAAAEDARRRADENYRAELARIQRQTEEAKAASNKKADAEIDAAQRAQTAKDALAKNTGAASTGALFKPDAAGRLRLELVVRNEQRAGSILRELSHDDIDTLAQQILGVVRQYQGIG